MACSSGQTRNSKYLSKQNAVTWLNFHSVLHTFWFKFTPNGWWLIEQWSVFPPLVDICVQQRPIHTCHHIHLPVALVHPKHRRTHRICHRGQSDKIDLRKIAHHHCNWLAHCNQIATLRTGLVAPINDHVRGIRRSIAIESKLQQWCKWNQIVCCCSSLQQNSLETWKFFLTLFASANCTAVSYSLLWKFAKSFNLFLLWMFEHTNSTPYILLWLSKLEYFNIDLLTKLKLRQGTIRILRNQILNWMIQIRDWDHDVMISSHFSITLRPYIENCEMNTHFVYFHFVTQMALTLLLGDVSKTTVSINFCFNK